MSLPKITRAVSKQVTCLQLQAPCCQVPCVFVFPVSRNQSDLFCPSCAGGDENFTFISLETIIKNPLNTATRCRSEWETTFQLLELCSGFLPNDSFLVACEHKFQCLFSVSDGLSCRVGRGLNTPDWIHCQQRRINVSIGANIRKMLHWRHSDGLSWIQLEHVNKG